MIYIKKRQVITVFLYGYLTYNEIKDQALWNSITDKIRENTQDHNKIRLKSNIKVLPISVIPQTTSTL